jgi:hypothetical protein
MKNYEQLDKETMLFLGKKSIQSLLEIESDHVHLNREQI